MEISGLLLAASYPWVGTANTERNSAHGYSDAPLLRMRELYTLRCRRCCFPPVSLYRRPLPLLFLACYTPQCPSLFVQHHFVSSFPHTHTCVIDPKIYKPQVQFDTANELK